MALANAVYLQISAKYNNTLVNVWKTLSVFVVQTITQFNEIICDSPVYLFSILYNNIYISPVYPIVYDLRPTFN